MRREAAAFDRPGLKSRAIVAPIFESQRDGNPLYTLRPRAQSNPVPLVNAAALRL